jgi:hypothetical protein
MSIKTEIVVCRGFLMQSFVGDFLACEFFNSHRRLHFLTAVNERYGDFSTVSRV